MAGPDETGELQEYFGSPSLRMEWVFPLDVSSLDRTAGAAAERRAQQDRHPVAGALRSRRAGRPTLTTSSNMLFSLNLFIATAQSVDTLLWLLYVSLTVAGLAVLLLAARMVAMRRSSRDHGDQGARRIPAADRRRHRRRCRAPLRPGGRDRGRPGDPRRPRAGSAQGAGSAGELVAADRRRGRRRLRSRPHRGLAAPPARRANAAPASAHGRRPAGHRGGAGGRGGGGHRRLPRPGRPGRARASTSTPAPRRCWWPSRR